MPSYRPATAFRRVSSSAVASRPGLNSRPVDIPSAPDCIASWTKPSIVAICSADGVEPDTPAARRIALWPTNHARFGVWPTSERNSRCSPKVDQESSACRTRSVQPAADDSLGGRRHGRVAPAAIADDLGRDALANRALGGRVREDREVAVAVRIDEPGADDLAGRVDHALGAGVARQAPDLDDPVALDRDVAEERRAARAVRDPAVPDQDVETTSYFLAGTSPTWGPSRGSRMSRSPSPSRLNPSTTIMIAAPGKIDSHGVMSM